VMPGEVARAHRHSAAALRLIIEGRGGGLRSLMASAFRCPPGTSSSHLAVHGMTTPTTPGGR
jgi:hypothetical protein